MAQEAKQTTVVTRLTTDFRALPELGRPGGAKDSGKTAGSFDIQFFEERATGKKWIGKCGQDAMSTPDILRQSQQRYPIENRRFRYFDEYREAVGLMLYQSLDIQTPEVVLSPQLAAELPPRQCDLHIISAIPVARFKGDRDVYLYVWTEDPNNRKLFYRDGAGRDSAVPIDDWLKFEEERLAIMQGAKKKFLKTDEIARLITANGGHVQARDDELEGYIYHQPCLHLMTKFVEGFQVLGKSFITAYQQRLDQSKPTTVTTPEGEELPLKGLGAALAMGCFLLDADCLGGGGANMGYVIQTDADGRRYAKLIKIDAGSTFSFLEGDAGIYAHDPRKRDMFFGLQKEFTLSYDQLSAGDQAEFAQIARRILQIPRAVFKAIIDRGIMPEGFTQKQADRILNELLARKATFLIGFKHEVSAQLKAEVQVARQALLADLVALAPVVVADEAEEEHKDEKEEKEEAVPDHQMALAQLDAREAEGIRNALMLEEQCIQGERPEDKAICQVFQLPAVSPNFTGRAEALARIAQTLSTRHGSVITQSISGLGGIGKTQLVVRYAQLASEGIANYGKQWGGKVLRYQAVVWLNAERSLDLQFITLAESWCGLEKPNTKEAIAVVYRYLAKKRTLIVFDNAVDQASIAPFLPPGPVKKSFWDRFKAASNCHTLITSRNTNWGISTLSLSGFTPEEAIAFVRKRLPEASEADIHTLVETVSNLPLALSHAVAYIADGNCSLQEYPQQFSLHQLSIVGQIHTAQGVADHTVLTTFLLTFVRLKQQHPVIVPLLQTCAYLAPEGIPIAWLETGLAGPAGEKGACLLGNFSLAEVREGLIALQRHGLLQSDKEGLVNMHRLVQQVIRHQLSPAEQEAQTSRVEQWLGTLNTEEHDNAAAEQRWKAFMPHLETMIVHHDQNALVENESLAALLGQLGNIYSHLLGQSGRGRDLLIRALAIKEAHYDRDHVEVAAILVNLGIAYGNLGDIVKKRDFLERALAIYEGHYGRDHPHVAITLVNLGTTHGALGDVTKQRGFLERALAIEEAHYGRDHSKVVGTLVNLGVAYGDLGDVVKQRNLLERALAILEAHYGRDHYRIASALMNLGNAYGDLGDVAKKRDLLERALTIDEAHYGQDHPYVAEILMNLGNAYGLLGNIAKQRNLLERALSIQEVYYDGDHPHVASTLMNLGTAYGDLGDIVKKRDFLERALAMQEAHYGRDHYKVAPFLANLGNAYSALGDTAKARDFLERALVIDEAHYGRDHYKVASTLVNLGMVYDDLGGTAKARGFLERALAIQERHYGREHSEVAITLTNLGSIYGNLGDVAKQRVLLRRALSIQEAYYGRDDHVLAVTLTNLGVAYGTLGNVATQRDLLERALTIEEAYYGGDHPQMAITLMNLGNAYGALGNIAKQRVFLERALAILEACYGRDHPELATTLTNLAVAHYRLKQPSAALQAAQRTYHILLHHPLYGAEHPKTKQLVGGLQSICKFTREELQGRVVMSDAKEAEQLLSAAASGLSSAQLLLQLYRSTRRELQGRVIIPDTEAAEQPLSVAVENILSVQLLSQQGLANNDMQELHQQLLGRAVLRLLSAINTQRQLDWDPDTHISYTATILSAFAKGETGYATLCEQPELHFVPAPLSQFIQSYVAQCPILHTLTAHPDFANNLRRALLQRKLNELYERFGVEKPQSAMPLERGRRCMVM